MTIRRRHHPLTLPLLFLLALTLAYLLLAVPYAHAQSGAPCNPYDPACARTLGGPDTSAPPIPLPGQDPTTGCVTVYTQAPPVCPPFNSPYTGDPNAGGQQAPPTPPPALSGLSSTPTGPSSSRVGFPNAFLGVPGLELLYVTVVNDSDQPAHIRILVVRGARIDEGEFDLAAGERLEPVLLNDWGPLQGHRGGLGVTVVSTAPGVLASLAMHPAGVSPDDPRFWATAKFLEGTSR